MNKFNIGDVVTGRYRNTWASDGKYKIKKIFLNNDNSAEYILEKINENDYCNSVRWEEKELKFVDEDKIKYNRELTFREVMAQIKEGEVWEDVMNKNITISKNGINLNRLDWTNSMFMSFDSKFKLQRKEYTFEEAFKSYEEGKEIESCVSGHKYKKGNLHATTLCGQDYLIQGYGIPISDISGNWYVNE